MNSTSLKERVLRWRRRAALRFGITAYCRVGKYQLMEELFSGKPPGVFIEAGAHDGWTGSNTYWLEVSMGWTGILVEPVPGLYYACCKERPGCKVFHGALVSNGYDHSTISIECSGLVSAVLESPMLAETRLIASDYYGASERPTERVPAITLDSCIISSGFNNVSLISLDVEGYEEQALRGIDLGRWQVQWLLIECNDESAVLSVIGDDYVVDRRLPPRDVLFRRKTC